MWKQIREVGVVILPYIMGAAIVLSLMTIVRIAYHPFIVSGVSMEPSYWNGEVVRCTEVNRDTTLARWDVVILNDNGRWLIKRIVGLPGETLTVKDGLLLINGEDAEYEHGPIEDAGVLEREYHLEENEYFCIGDNVSDSRDSREFGGVQRSNIVSKVDSKMLERSRK